MRVCEVMNALARPPLAPMRTMIPFRVVIMGEGADGLHFEAC